MKKIKILIVEDEPLIAMDIQQTVMRLGYEVSAIVNSGKKALAQVDKDQPDLILMDILLAGSLDGIETATIINKNYHIPIIYLTGFTDEVTLKRATKSEPFGYIVKPFEDQDVHSAIEIALARSNAEAKILKALEKERELHELKSQFVTIVSHEFRTPMATILFSSGLLEKYGALWPEERRLTHLHRIQCAIQNMTNLLDSILLIGQSEAGKLTFKPVPLALENFCQELTEEMQLLAGDRQQLTFVCHSQCDKSKIDESLLRQILINLLSNAIKYSLPGGKINFELTYDPQHAIFIIQDEGIGIPITDQVHLFETFYRASNVGTISGTGLGLSIVQRAVKLHGGEVSFHSQVGVGTTFIVKLPI